MASGTNEAWWPQMEQVKTECQQPVYTLEQAEALIEKLNVVSGFVQHDIRNKLSIINCSLFLVKKYACPNSQLEKQFEQICFATKDIVHLLDFSKTYESAGARGLSWISISKAVNDAFALSSSLRRVAVDLSNIDFEVLADEALVEIFHNFHR